METSTNTCRRLNLVVLLSVLIMLTFLVFQDDLTSASFEYSNIQLLKSLSNESDCTANWFMEKDKPFKWIPILKHEESKYFSPLEIISIPNVSSSRNNCPKEHLAEACCVGSRANGVGSGNLALEGCYEDSTETFSFFVQRYPVNFRRRLILRDTSTLYNMADVYSLLNGRHLLLQGDSLMNQNFDNLLCDLQRYTGYEVNLNRYKRKKRKDEYGIHYRHVATIKGHKSKIILHREYKFTLDGSSIKESCESTDVLVMNYGIHWNDIKKYEKELSLLPDLLRRHCEGVLVIFRGTTSQHFLTRDGSGRYQQRDGMSYIKEIFNSERFGHKKLSFTRMGCQKLFKPANVRDDPVIKAFQKSGMKVYNAMELKEANWVEYHSVKTKANVILFIPFEDITAELHDHHYTDCTHYCNGPYFWSVIYHFVAKALGATGQGISNSHAVYNAIPWKINEYQDKPK